MTVEEALIIVETVLDYQRLNHVQEIVFRQSWDGLSYREIASSTGYAEDYLKDAGAKLWKHLSKAFGEKVKKDNIQSVIKRYLRQNQASGCRNKVIEVNLNGADLNGAGISVANFSGARLLFTNLSESNLEQADLSKYKILDDKTELEEEEIKSKLEVNLNPHSTSANLTHTWNGWQFRSTAEVKIAEALDRAGVLFFPKATARLTTPEGRQNQEPHFLVCYQGKLGILAVDVEAGEVERVVDGILQSQGIRTIQHYDIAECSTEPDRVVLEFLQLLSQG